MKLLNCCIVCYRNVGNLSSSTVNENGDCVTARFIRLFKRHVNYISLESTQIKIRGSALTILPGNQSDSEPIQFQACVTCSEMLSSFNSSYGNGNIKCAEMRANWSLQQLANVIRFADYAPARKTKLRESVNDLEDGNLLINDMIEVISKFRQQLQHHCRLGYKNQFPRVVLMKPGPNQTSKENNIKDKVVCNQRWTPSAQSYATLISTALKNLSSLQLILYLALFDSLKIVDKISVSSTIFEANTPLDHVDNLGSEVEAGVEEWLEQEEETFSDQSLRTVFKCDKDSGDGLNCSTLDVREADNVPFLCKTNGCGKRFYTTDSVTYQCHNKYVNEPLTKSSDESTKKYREYRIKIIKHVPLHQCSPCQLEFDSGNELQQHLEMESCTKIWNDPDPKNTCSGSKVQIKQEPKKIPSQKKNTRGTSHLKRNNYKYRCKQCGLRSKYPANLRRHELIHLGPEAWKYLCSICGKRFLTKQNVTVHMLIHSGEKPFKCSVDNCEKAFTSQHGLKKHLQNPKYHRTITRRGKLNCKQCGHLCKNMTSLSRHKLNHLEPKYSCSYCGRKFIHKQNMETHLRRHTGEKPYNCPVEGCTMAFAHSQGLQHHRRKFHPTECP